MTVNERIADLQRQFLHLSASYRAKLVREARLIIELYPHAADHSTFWCGLSARQVLIASINTHTP